AIAECLLQSHLRSHDRVVLNLLPALLPEWPEGKVCGLRAQGGLTVDMQWQNGKLSQAGITADFDTEVVINGSIIKLQAGIPQTING
ncbi:MAG: hypothetical protein IKZ31_00375, partial [Lentisphaeria bacterium]|nr:hypothetical protein [Lentisphaeria bacterium]